MTAPVKRRVTVSKLETVGDNTIKLSIYTSLEQDGNQAGELFGLKGKEVDMYLVEPGQDLEADHVDEAPPYEKTNPARSKSPSQTVRQEMWAYHRAAGIEEPFDAWYEERLGVYMRYWHDQRMAL